MFGSDKDVTLTIKARDEASATLNGVNASVGKLAAGFAIGGIAIKGFTSAFGVLSNVVSDSLIQFRESETAQVRLAQILSTSTGATREQINVLYEQAEALEKVGVVSADTITIAQGTFATFDLTANSINRLIPAFLDMVVAEKGVNATTDDMISFANGLGQALQGNYQSLSQRGFILDATTKKLIEHGTESQRVAAIIDVLNSTYEGMNETMRGTTEGSIKAATLSFEKLKQNIGQGLSPIIGNLISVFGEVAQKMIGTSDVTMIAFTAFKRLSEMAFIVGDVLIQLGVIIGRVITTIGSLIAAAIRSSELKKKFDDAGEGIKNFGEEANKALNSFFLKNMETEESLKALADSGTKATATLAEGTGRLPGKPSKDVDKLKEKLEDLKAALTKVRQTGVDELSSLAKSHDDNMTRSRERIAELEKSLRSLSESYAHAAGNAANAFSNSQASDRRGIADEIIKQKKLIEDLKSQVGLETDPHKKIELRKQLIEEQRAYEENADFIQTLDSEVKEAQRRAGLTEFERTIEDYKAKREAAVIEYNGRRMDAEMEYEARKKELKAQLIQEQTKMTEQTNAYNNAYNSITQSLAAAEAMRLAISKKSAEESILLVNKQIEAYNRLAEAIQRASQGKPTQIVSATLPVREFGGIVPGPVGTAVPIMAHGQERVISASKANSTGGQGSGSTINVNINNPVVRSDSDIAAMREIMEEAWRDISRVHKLSTI